MRVITLIFLCLTAGLNGTSPVEKGKNLRILKMLPELSCPFNVEPAIPDDFVALSPTGKPNIAEWVYWGPRDVLEAYFKDPHTLKRAIFRVKLSKDIVQKGSKIFDAEDEKVFLEMKKQNPQFQHKDAEWGEYPVSTINVGKEGYIAWVGLNNKGCTLLFNFIYPKAKQSEKDKKLWDRFITETKMLTEADSN